MGTQDEYAKEIRDNLSCFAVWEPGEKVAPGDAGFLKGRIFEQETHLGKMFPKLRFDVVTDATPSPRAFYSKDCTIRKGAGGAGLPSRGDASVTVQFHKQGGVIADYSTCTRRYIDDVFSVGRYLSKHKHDWPRSMVLVSQTEESKSFAVRVSESKDYEVEVTGNVAPIQELRIAHASVDLRTLQGQGYERAGKGPVTMRLFGFKWWGRRPRPLAAGTKAPEEGEFAEISARDPSLDAGESNVEH